MSSDKSGSQLCVTSYNSTGFGQDKIDFMKTLLLFSDVLSVQEHFLLSSDDRKHSNTDKIRRAFGDNYDMFVVPAVKSNENVTKGRGKGGLFTLWKKGLTKYVSKVESSSYRLQATKFQFPSSNLLIINSYFMCDPGGNFEENELMQLLAEVRRIIEVSRCQNISLQGDLNCDFSRQTPFVQIVRALCEELDIESIWSHPRQEGQSKIAAVSHTYCQLVENVARNSLVDHFIFNKNLYEAIVEAGSVQSVDNFSWHDPIYCKLSLGKLNLDLETVNFKPKPSWKISSDHDKQAFSDDLDIRLSEIKIPACVQTCRDLECEGHVEEINVYCEDILEAIEDSANETLPKTKPPCTNRKLLKPGWKEHVQPFKEEALYWKSLWRRAGKPYNHPLFINMKSSKAQYKYAIRRLNKSTEQIQNNAFLSSILHGKSRNIYKEVKKFRGQQRTVSSRIDGDVGSKQIADHFANKYQDLYGKCELGQDFTDLKNTINECLNDGDIEEVMSIDENVVKEALKRMKGGKEDVSFNFSSDCLINGPELLHKHLANLFRLFLLHGQVASILLLCSLIPIVKNKLGDLTSSENYRAIAKSSLILKLFDWVLLLSQGWKLSSDQLQFGYQSLSSTVMCTWAASSVISHFNRAGSDVFGALLDCSKAFDMVEWVTLFKELLKRKVSPVFLRVLLFTYSEQKCCVQWNGEVSFQFVVRNGVRQGAVSSPILFGIYVDKLIRLLREF